MTFQRLHDCEGVSLESEKPFAFQCCDCALVHRVVLASEDGKPVGFAVQRDVEATAVARGIGETDDAEQLFNEAERRVIKYGLAVWYANSLADTRAEEDALKAFLRAAFTFKEQK